MTDKVTLFQQQYPGWTLKIRSCGHFEAEMLPTIAATYVQYPTPTICQSCAARNLRDSLENQYWQMKWKQLKDEMENG